MVSLAKMASTSSLISAFTRFVATAMFVKTMIREIQNLIGQMVPQQIQHKLVSFIEGLFRGAISSQMMLVIEESNGITTNELYSASEIYLDSTPRITPSMKLLIVHKDPREQRISTAIDKGQRIPDAFDGIKLVWEFAHRESKKRSRDERVERWIRLSFEKEHLDKVLNSYLPYVVSRANAIKEEKRAVRLHTLPHYTKVNLNHPSTFDTLAIDPEIKKTLLEDLDRFLKRRDLYRKVGKPWKRGYLLYGPPGTGKSSLVAAMANYLKFDIYDLELTSLRSNSGLKTMLSGTRNRSILVIEDIDCSAEIPTRSSSEDRKGQSSQFTLSGLLNFIDGLWSSCGDERIIVFTTNYKHKLDPALLRPGRMDMHIHMSYCTSSGFRTLASNYHGIKTHRLFDEIDRLLAEVEVTAAEIAEELLKSEDADAAFQGLVGFILKKKEMKGKGVVKVKEEKKKTKKGMQGKDVSKNNATENGKLALLILSLLAVVIASASLILTIVA